MAFVKSVSWTDSISSDRDNIIPPAEKNNATTEQVPKTYPCFSRFQCNGRPCNSTLSRGVSGYNLTHGSMGSVCRPIALQSVQPFLHNALVYPTQHAQHTLSRETWYDVIHKPEVHNVSQRRQRSEPRQ